LGFDRLWRLAESRSSRLIVAVDEVSELGLLDWLLERVSGNAIAVKFGFLTLLRLGVDGIRRCIKEWRDKFYFIADYKLADIPHINSSVLKMLEDLGFEAATIHVFQRGLEKIVRNSSLELIGIAAMSHESPLLDQLFRENLEYARRVGIGGVVVGATKPTLISEAKRMGFVVFSPGLGVQGGVLGDTIRHGADFDIVGRSITSDPDPREASIRVVEAERLALRKLH